MCYKLTDVCEVRRQRVDPTTEVHVLRQPENIITILKWNRAHGVN